MAFLRPAPNSREPGWWLLSLDRVSQAVQMREREQTGMVGESRRKEAVGVGRRILSVASPSLEATSLETRTKQFARSQNVAKGMTIKTPFCGFPHTADAKI